MAGGVSAEPSLAGVAGRSLRRLRPSRSDLAAAMVILAATPVAAALVARGLAMATDARAASIERRVGPAIAAIAVARAEAAEVDRARPLLMRPTISTLSGRIAQMLPDGAHLAALSVDDEGVVAAEVDCLDPDQLADAIAADPMLSALHRVGQRPASADGVRVLLSSPRP